MTVWWFAIFVVLIVIELLTVNLVTIWFALGAVAAITISIFNDSLILQLIGFIVVSVLSLIMSKPLIMHFRVRKITPTNLDRVVGERGEVVKKIFSDKSGEVKVLGNIWTASSTKTFEVGDKIKVKKIEGVKLIVEEDN